MDKIEEVKKIDRILAKMCFDLIGGSDLCKKGRCQVDELMGLCSGLHQYRKQICQLFEPEPNMLAECNCCGHPFEEHDWGAYRTEEATCLVEECNCRNFLSKLTLVDGCHHPDLPKPALPLAQALIDIKEAEAKPGESRLLPDKELLKIYGTYVNVEELRKISKAQLAKADAYWWDLLDSVITAKDAECQDKVEKIFKAIQDFYQTKFGDVIIPEEDWQVIKKAGGNRWKLKIQ